MRMQAELSIKDKAKIIGEFKVAIGKLIDAQKWDKPARTWTVYLSVFETKSPRDRYLIGNSPHGPGANTLTLVLLRVNDDPKTGGYMVSEFVPRDDMGRELRRALDYVFWEEWARLVPDSSMLEKGVFNIPKGLKKTN